MHEYCDSILYDWHNDTSYDLNCLTSWIEPCPQMVMAGNSISDTGFPVVWRVVKVGLACHSWYACMDEGCLINMLVTDNPMQ